MMRHTSTIFITFFFCFPALMMGMTGRDIAEKMAAKADQMDREQAAYGYWRESIDQNLDGDNRVKNERKKLSRIIWLEDHPYLELVRLDDKDLDTKQKAVEAKKKTKFLKRLQDAKKDDEDTGLSWKELFQKYDFTLVPSDDPSVYVVSFSPKQTGLTERNTGETVFNRLSGTLRIDEEFNLMRATAHLGKSVKIGMGVVGRLNSLEIDYRQQKHQDLWLPASFEFRAVAQMLMFKVVRQQIHARYFDYYPRPASGRETPHLDPAATRD